MVPGERCVAILLFSLLVLAPALAPADQSKAGVVVAVVGESTVTRTSLPQPVPLKFKDDVLLRDRIDTHENSIARLLLGGRAVVTIRELSVFTITDEPDRAAVDLQRGKLAVGVAKSRLRPGEAVEIRTPNAIVGIRGSSVVVDVGVVAGVLQTMVATLEVSVPVTVTFRADPGITVSLPSHHVVTVSREGRATMHTPVVRLPAQQNAELAKTSQIPVGRQRAGLPSRVIDGMVDEAGRLATRLTVVSPTDSIHPAATSISTPGPGPSDREGHGGGASSPRAGLPAVGRGGQVRGVVPGTGAPSAEVTSGGIPGVGPGGGGPAALTDNLAPGRGPGGGGASGLTDSLPPVLGPGAPRMK